MCVPSPEHTLRTLSTNRRGEGEAPPPAPSTYTARGTRPAPARLTPGPYVSVSAGGGGEEGEREEGRENRRRKKLRGRERWRRPWQLQRVWGWGWGEGAGTLRTRRGLGAGPALRRALGGGDGRLVGSFRSSRVGPPRLPHSLPPPPPGRSVNPSPLRWAVRGASGFLRTDHPPRARLPGPLPAAASQISFAPVPGDAGHEWEGVIPSRPSFRNVRERSQGWLPPSPTRTALRNPAGTAAPRVRRRSGACWELESPTAAAPADLNWPRVLATPTVPALNPGCHPRGKSEKLKVTTSKNSEVPIVCLLTSRG
ncbi:uncharacterized protein WM277_001170 isoform 1-T1 [Molossus nigricans]